MALISSLHMLPSLTPPPKHSLASSVYSVNPVLGALNKSLLFAPEQNQGRNIHRLCAKKGNKESTSPPPPQETKTEEVEMKVGEETVKAGDIQIGNEFSKLTSQVGTINPSVALTKGIKFLEGKWILVFMVLNVLLFWLF